MHTKLVLDYLYAPCVMSQLVIMTKYQKEDPTMRSEKYSHETDSSFRARWIKASVSDFDQILLGSGYASPYVANPNKCVTYKWNDYQSFPNANQRQDYSHVTEMVISFGFDGNSRARVFAGTGIIPATYGALVLGVWFDKNAYGYVSAFAPHYGVLTYSVSNMADWYSGSGTTDSVGAWNSTRVLRIEHTWHLAGNNNLYLNWKIFIDGTLKDWYYVDYLAMSSINLSTFRSLQVQPIISTHCYDGGNGVQTMIYKVTNY